MYAIRSYYVKEAMENARHHGSGGDPSLGIMVSFEDFAVDTYGRHIAEAFLLGYSEKLWSYNFV